MKIIQWATGAMGKTCLRAVIDRPDLELVGLFVYGERKAGLDAGEIARRLEVPHNTLSTHLGVLSRAGLIHSQREGRSLIYRANLEHMLATVQFLVRDCCAGSSVVCDPLLASLTVPDCSASSTPCASQEPGNDD